MGTLPIQLELGRYSRVAVQERLCKVCKSGQIEDEYHLLFQCERYKVERVEWLDKKGLKPVSTEVANEFEIAFNKPYVLGKYLNEIMNVRNKVLMTGT